MTVHRNAWSGAMDDSALHSAAVAADAGYPQPPARKGFFTDTSVCIGCKACEVACKIWNDVPEDGLNLLGLSYDNTGALGASTWRHVAFIEQPATPVDDSATETPPAQPIPVQPIPAGVEHPGGEHAGGGPVLAEPPRPAPGPVPVQLGMPGSAPPGAASGVETRSDFRWLMSSDVCKHCTHAACLDVCPTGALFRTEFSTVVVQADICNGCGYCVTACPYGVIERRQDDGRAWKCTLCYDRLKADQTPACAQACPTQSIQFGDLDELRTRAADRLATLHDAGVGSARLYGESPEDGVGGAGAFFLLLDQPEVYGLPPDPVVTTRDLPAMWRSAGLAAATLLAGLAGAFLGRRP